VVLGLILGESDAPVEREPGISERFKGKDGFTEFPRINQEVTEELLMLIRPEILLPF
jgi:hypothetical protein